MDAYTIALFGEAEKGDYHKVHQLSTLPQLIERFGHPPPESQGLFFAIQALMYDRNLLYFRVEEEGYSHHDYYFGINLLKQRDLIQNITAFCIPGVGDTTIIEEIIQLCTVNQSILITSEADLYDYLTSTPEI